MDAADQRIVRVCAQEHAYRRAVKKVGRQDLPAYDLAPWFEAICHAVSAPETTSNDLVGAFACICFLTVWSYNTARAPAQQPEAGRPEWKTPLAPLMKPIVNLLQPLLQTPAKKPDARRLIRRRGGRRCRKNQR